MSFKNIFLFITAVFLMAACTPTATQSDPTIAETAESAQPPLEEMANVPETAESSPTPLQEEPIEAETAVPVESLNDARPTPTNEAVLSPLTIDGSKWILQSYGPVGQQLQPAAEATAEFDNGNELYGTTGCNNYFTTYTLTDSSLVLGAIQQTRMACSATVQPQEEAFIAALQTAKSLYIDGSNLVIVYDGGELHFAPQPPPPATTLDGTSWHLVLFQEGNFSYSPAGAITAEFNNGQITGSSGCNSYGGNFAVDGTNITISELAQTLQACLDESIMAQEAAYTTALLTVNAFVLDGDSLTLTYGGGSLIFNRSLPAATLEGPIWQLVSYTIGTGPQTLVIDSEISAQFSQGQLNGSGGCNSYFSTYTLDGNTLTTGAIGSTKMACAEELMTQETNFFMLLGDAANISVSLSADQLTLIRDGDMLVFVAQ